MFRHSHGRRHFGQRGDRLMQAVTRLTGLQTFLIAYSAGLAFFVTMTL